MRVVCMIYKNIIWVYHYIFAIYYAILCSSLENSDTDGPFTPPGHFRGTQPIYYYIDLNFEQSAANPE